MRIPLLNRRKLIAGSGGKYIKFKDPVVEAICVANWSSDGIGLTKEDAAAVTSLSRIFRANKSITSFDELKFFTGLTTIIGGNNASNGDFADCSNLQSVVLPRTITTIGGNAFAYSGLASIEIPEGVTDIALYSFRQCTNLAYVKIPSTVTSFGVQAFVHCTSLQTFICLATTPPTLGSNALYDVPSTCKFYVPHSADHSILDAYKAAWTAQANQIYELDENGIVSN